jgi:glutamate-1-semialdehyde 2,1-aminomutase
VLGGGLAVGAYAGRSQWMSLVAPEGRVYQAGTLSANPIGMRAGLATLQKMKDVDGWKTLDLRTQAFCADLNSFLTTQGLPLRMDCVTSIFWIHSLADQPIRTLQQIPANNAGVFKKLFHAALERRVYLAPSGYEVGFISLAHTDAILEQALRAIKEAIRATYESL